MLKIEREFEDVPLTLDDGRKVGAFTGTAEIAVIGYGEAPYVASITVSGHKLSVANWGDWAVQRMLSATLLVTFGEDFDEAYNEHYASEIAAEAAENSIGGHDRG